MKNRSTFLFSMVVLVVLAVVLFPAAYAGACSELLLNKTGENVISGRIMDFKFDFKSKFVPVRKGTVVDMRLPEGSSEGSFTTLYGFVGIDTLGKPLFSDGLNTEGLSVAALWLDGTEYQHKEDNPGKKVLPSTYLPHYVLGLCATVDEVKKVLDEFTVTEVRVKELGGKVPIHFIFHDRRGKSLIVEYIKGKPRFYDSKVMNNDPAMDIHLAKLREYNRIMASPLTSEGFLDMQCIAIAKLIDKDYSDNRFLLLSMLNNTVAESKTTKEAVTNCLRVMDRVNIAKHEWENNKGGEGASTNMWTIVRDHKALKIYFKSYKNETVQMVDVRKLLVGPKQKIHLTSGEWFREVTK